MFLKAFLCDISGISTKKGGDWTKRNRLEEGYYWTRDENERCPALALSGKAIALTLD